MDDKKMNEYLEVVKRNLKYLTISEKTDIINEIKSHIKETQMKQEIDLNTVLQNLGDPSELGKAYAGKTIVSTTSFNLKNFIRTISFYGATSLGTMFLSVLAGCLYLCIFLVIIGGIIKTAGNLLGFDMSFVVFKVGNWLVPDLLAFPVSIPIAILFYFCSKKLWNVLKAYFTKSNKYREV